MGFWRSFLGLNPKNRVPIFFWRLRSRSPASQLRASRPARPSRLACGNVSRVVRGNARAGKDPVSRRVRARIARGSTPIQARVVSSGKRGLPPSVPVARLGPIDARARTRLPNEIDMTIVDSGRESRVAAAARTAGIASASSSPAAPAPEPAPRGFAAHTVGEEHFYGHMLSGALAGTTEHCAMFPLDTIKTRMQTATTSAVAGATLGGSTVPSQLMDPAIGNDDPFHNQPRRVHPPRRAASSARTASPVSTAASPPWASAPAPRTPSTSPRTST